MIQKKQVRRTGQLIAEDKNGKRYTIIEYTTFHDISNPKEPDKWISGLKGYKLEDGTPINKLNDTEFEADIFGNTVKLNLLS